VVTIYIEGDARLREGFSSLLEKMCASCDISIIMGRSRDETVRKFKCHRVARGTEKCLLIDLDMPNARRLERVKQYGLTDIEDNVFFMVQEMEAWFLSQQDILKEYYHCNTLRFKNNKADEIEKPCLEIVNITSVINNRYEKIQHAIDLLKKLNIIQLKQDFIDVGNLSIKLQNI
jgi:hypothetical protein